MQTKGVLELHPDNYYTLKEELCFYVGDNTEAKNSEKRKKLREELLKIKSLTVYSHDDKGDYLIMATPNFLFHVKRSEENNFAIQKIISDKELISEKKHKYFGQDAFLIIAKGGISVIMNKIKRSSHKLGQDEWRMAPEVIGDLCEKIDAYFSGSDPTGNTRNVETGLLMPVEKYTYYEDQAEQLNAYGDDYIDYERYEIIKSSAEQKIYEFYSTSFDPGNEKYQVEDRVAVETNEFINDELKKKLKGIIVDRIEDMEGVRFRIEFREQFDHEILEVQHGRIFIQANETQKIVRQRVIKNIRNRQVASTYIYQFYPGYKTAGYIEEPEWEEFRKELLEQKYPPNASQMEAIKRGIETKDIQLVLGPPGTGKTTVIVAWVKYFIRHGKRVLVSSQNNSAVDNVLERVGKEEGARIIRLGNLLKIQENCKKYSIEEQVDGVAENYILKLNETKGNILSDMESIEGIVMTLDQLRKYKEIFDEHAEKLQNTQRKLRKTYTIKDEVYRKYKRLYETKIHKEVCISAIKKKNWLWQMLCTPLAKKLCGEIETLNKELWKYANLYIQSISTYNDVSVELQELLRDYGYLEAKKMIVKLEQDCKEYHASVKLKGPFKVGKAGGEQAVVKEIQTYEDLVWFRKELVDKFERLKKLERAFIDWEKSINSKRTEIVTSLLIKNCNIVGATCIGINTRRTFQDVKFDVSIIDESGQIQIHNAIVPMTRAPKTLMLGDHQQIPPMADDTVVRLCKQDGVSTDLLEKSFFEHLFTKLEEENSNTPNITRLNEQFRMPGNISDVISEWFYQGNYHAHYDMSKWEPMVKGTCTPLVLVSTSRSSDRFETAEKDGGYTNELEACIIARIVAKLFNDQKELDNEQVGIISAYGKQVFLIRRKIRKEGIGFLPEQINSMAASLDSFQGQERPLIIYSATRSSTIPPNRARVGFLKELRRLNVAFTRCQKQLIIVGDFDYLTSCEYEKLGEDGEPVPNQSEKKYAEFMQKMVDQAKSEKGEFYSVDEFYKKAGIKNGKE